MTNFTANPTALVIGPDMGDFTIYSYINEDHLLADMLNATYFSNVRSRLRKRDFILIEDAKGDSELVRVAEITPDYRVILHRTLTVKFEAVPDQPGDEYIIQWKGPRGGYFHILDKAGQTIARDLRTRPLAERELDILKSKAA